jgi:hypothetical protein
MHHSGDGGGRQARGAPTQAPDKTRKEKQATAQP